MADFFYSQSSTQLQSNMDKVSATTGDLIDTNNLESNTNSFGYSKYTENRFKGNQNFNVNGSSGDPLPDGTPRTYSVGSEVAAGVEVITNNAEQITYTSGVLNSGNNTGILRRRYKKDAAGLITKSTQYGGLKLADNSQIQALVDDIATNGVRITEDGSDVVVDVDLSVVTTGFRFFGMSDIQGVWQAINEQESISSLYAFANLNSTVKTLNVPADRDKNVAYTNDTQYVRRVFIKITTTGTSNFEANLTSTDGTFYFIESNGFVTNPVNSLSLDIYPGESYTFTFAGLTTQQILEWKERDF